MCYQSVYEQEVSTLKSSIALLNEEVLCLKAEVKRLKGDHTQNLHLPLSLVVLSSRAVVVEVVLGVGRGGGELVEGEEVGMVGIVVKGEVGWMVGQMRGWVALKIMST